MLIVPLMAAGSGCIPLPGKQVVAARSSYNVDPRTLCGKNRPIHVGATRDEVRAAVGEEPQRFRVPESWPATRVAPTAGGWYTFYMRVGSFFWIGPNPEGGFIGVNRWYRHYTLSIDYDDADRVIGFKMETNEAFDPHESAFGRYE